MPGAAVVAAALTTHAAHPYGLFLYGVDLIPMTPLESVHVIEAGPNGVSSLDFTIEDPGKTITLSNAAEVTLWNLPGNQLLFRGYIDHWSARPDFGGQGRSFDVSCSGVEIWLDWLIVFPEALYLRQGGGGGSLLQDTNPIDLLVKIFARYGNSPVHAFRNIGSADSDATYGLPGGSGNESDGLSIRNVHTAVGSDTTYLGVTVREMIQDALQISVAATALDPPADAFATVDFNLGLRWWANYTSASHVTYDQPDDYTTLTVVDTIGGAIVAANLHWDVLPTDIIRTVYITGFDAASSGIFTDGTGLPGATTYINDPLITTAALALNRAQAIIAAGYISIRGSFDLEDWTPPTTVHPGGLLDLTDASTGATNIYRIMQIEKTFTGDAQNWTVSFGGMPPSAMTLTKQLTA